MSVFNSAFVGLVAFNALLFISLTFFRRDRPAARLRLFRWVLHTNSRHRALGRASGTHRRGNGVTFTDVAETAEIEKI
jgi:hypothetical protein